MGYRKTSFGKKVVALYSASAVNYIVEEKNTYLSIDQGYINVTM